MKRTGVHLTNAAKNVGLLWHFFSKRKGNVRSCWCVSAVSVILCCSYSYNHDLQSSVVMLQIFLTWILFFMAQKVRNIFEGQTHSLIDNGSWFNNEKLRPLWSIKPAFMTGHQTFLKRSLAVLSQTAIVYKFCQFGIFSFMKVAFK